MSLPRAKQPGRLAFLDWFRGIAALIMLQGHVFHSFARNDLRESGPYIISQFVGGMPPAMFLFLVGVTLAFLLDSHQKKGARTLETMKAVWRRAGYLLFLAFAFRLQMWVFALPHQPWTDLLRVDILNAMGFGVLVFSVMAAFTTAERVRHGAVLGVVIAALSPLVSEINWAGAPPLVRSYLAPDYQSFGFFPWAAFLAFGLSAGSLMRTLKPEQMERAAQWAALVGLSLIVGGRYFANVPYSLYSKADFWLDSPLLTFIKLGVMLVGLSFAFLWNRGVNVERFSLVRQLGTHSLLVYWVHIELVYGFWLWRWKENLSLAECAAASVGVIALMVLLTVVKDNWRCFKPPIVAGWQWALARVRAAERP